MADPTVEILPLPASGQVPPASWQAPAPTPAFVWRGRLRRIIDADTLEIELDSGFHSRHVLKLRLLGVNAPEPAGTSKAAGLAATAFVTDWMDRTYDGWNDFATHLGVWPLVVRTHKPDSFGRWLAEVWDLSGRSLQFDLATSGHAVLA